MAQTKFFRMELDFQFIKDNYKEPEFKRFILQPYIPDAKDRPNEFELLIYAMDNKGDVMKQKDLKIDASFFFNAKNRVEFGNIPFTKKQVKRFIDADVPPGTIESLLFKPYDYGNYVAYKVKAKPSDSALLGDEEDDLKPSPPAPPEEGD